MDQCLSDLMFITYAQSSLNKWNWNPKRHFLYSLCLVHNGVCNYEMIQSVKPAFEPKHNSIKQVVTLTVIFQGLKMKALWLCTIYNIVKLLSYLEIWFTIKGGLISESFSLSQTSKAELLQLSRTQFPTLGIFVGKKVRNQKN